MALPNEKILELVKSSGTLNESSLKKAEDVAKKTKSLNLGGVLIESGIISEDQLGAIIAGGYNVPFISLSKLTVPPEIARIIPEKVARSTKSFAFARGSDGVKVALSDPSNKTVLSMVARKTGGRAIPYFAFEKDIERVVGLYKKALQKTIDELLREYVKQFAIGGEAPIAKVVDELVISAFNDRASDIHIEPEEETSLIRFRIDGVLQDVVRIPASLHDRIITRIKVLSNLRTDEHLSAQDGKMREKLPDEDLDIRVSIIPVSSGEKVVLRLLSSRSREYTLADLGINDTDLAKVTKAHNRSYGMILSTGPTGSGKTTSIYAILKILNTREKNIMTIEDPIEYRIIGANQVQVNAKTNLTFANGLRSILRQDPNIIFVGEIRDSETAGIAVNAALTGHLVLSTLHTNDAATAIPRLTDMKVEPFLVASTINVIIAQRLVREICSSCREAVEEDALELAKRLPKADVIKFFGNIPKIKVYRGAGCKVCRNTGYQGRIGIFEILEITKAIRKLILEKTDADIIEQAAIAEGMKTMLEDGLEKAARGLTTIEEVLRATKAESI
jgi:type IV pilus assembly protein PilB